MKNILIIGGGNDIGYCLSKMLMDNNFLHLKSLVPSAVGSRSADPNKSWIVDIDEVYDVDFGKDFSGNVVKIPNWQLVVDYINTLQPIGDKLKYIVPTLHGLHLITKPFNLQQFVERYPNIDIHKDNPTLLYFNNETV